MILLGSLIAVELAVILHIAMYINGRRAERSIFIRSDVLVGIVANIVVALLLGRIVGLSATMLEWWEQGVQVPYLWAMLGSVVVAFWLVRRVLASARLAGISLLGNTVVAT